MRRLLRILGGLLVTGLALAQPPISGGPVGGGNGLPPGGTVGECVVNTAPGQGNWNSCSGTASTAWANLTSGTNTTAAMVVGTGASLTPSGTGGITANAVTSGTNLAAGTLSATGTVSGAGFTSLFASPPAIGGTAAAAGAFTTLSASSTVSGSGFSTYLASPPAIGSSTSASGAFTTLSASSTVSGTGFSTYLASPPAIGGTTPAAGNFTTLGATSNLTINVTGSTQCLHASSAGVVSGTGSDCGSGGGGGGNVSNSGTPTQYQTAAWVSATTIQGVGPGTSGQALISGGGSAYPAYGLLSLAALATEPNNTVICNISGGSASPIACTAPQALQALNSGASNSQTVTSYPLALTDENGLVTMSNASANTVCIPPNSTVAFPLGTTVTIEQLGSGATSLAPAGASGCAGSGVTVESLQYGSSTSQTYQMAGLYDLLQVKQVNTNVWLVTAVGPGRQAQAIPLPLAFGGTGATTLPGANIATFTTSNPVSGHCPQWSGTTGLLVDSGAACGGGGGSGTVNSGTQYQMGYYATTGTAISGSGASIVPNGNNGYTIEQIPIAVTGANAQSANGNFSYGNSAFTGNVYNDTVAAIGYNVDGQTQVSSTSVDKFAGGYYSESNYEVENFASTATSVTGTTVLTDTAQSMPINAYAGWTIYIPSLSASQKITSNTATAFTFPSITGLTGTPAYQVLIDQMETYIQWSINPGSGAVGFRPWFYTFDRGTAQAESALGTAGAITVTSMTAANPVVVTTSVNHGFQSGPGAGYTVRFTGLAGGTWSTISGIAYLATPTGATTFTIPVNGTGLGTYTASSGTVKEDPFIGASEIMASPATGYRITIPCWNAACLATTDQMANFSAGGLHSLYSPTGAQTYLTLNGPTLGPAAMILSYNGTKSADVYSGSASVGALRAYNGGTAANAMYWGNFPSGDTWSTVGTNGVNFNATNGGGVLTVSNTGMAVATPVLGLQNAASQTGDMLDFWASNGTTKLGYFSSTGTFAGGLGGYTVNVGSQSGTTCTLTSSGNAGCSSITNGVGDCGTVIKFTSNSAVTVTIPATLAVGCQIAIEQGGTAKVSVNGTAVTAATLHSAHSYTGTSAQYAMIGVTIDANAGGSSAIAVLTGDGS